MRKKICFVVAVPGTAKAFLRDHMILLDHHYDIYMMGNVNDKDLESIKELPIKEVLKIDIERGISFWRDVKAIVQAWQFFRKYKFDAVHSVTPKAGLVCAIAGKLAGIKHRTHIFTGQVWATRKGFLRWLLKSLDKVISNLDNHILVDGKSQRSFLIAEGVLKEGQAKVFCHGSIAGVNAERFIPNEDDRQIVRKECGISDNMLTFIFLGRLNHDKGIGELYEAYNKLANIHENVFLLLVGVDEESYIEKLSSYSSIIPGKNFKYYGPTNNPGKVLNAGDVFVLPTWREGFGSSVLESACIGLPCICSDAYGVLDAYIENVTGLKCHVGDSESLYNCMKKMYDNPELRLEMGRKSRERALKDFNVKPISEEWLLFYKEILG